MVTVLLKVILSALTSNPAGRLTSIPAVRLMPDTLKLVDTDGIPCAVLNAVKAPVAVMAGVLLKITFRVTGCQFSKA